MTDRETKQTFHGIILLGIAALFLGYVYFRVEPTGVLSAPPFQILFAIGILIAICSLFIGWGLIGRKTVWGRQ